MHGILFRQFNQALFPSNAFQNDLCFIIAGIRFSIVHANSCPAISISSVQLRRNVRFPPGPCIHVLNHQAPRDYEEPKRKDFPSVTFFPLLTQAAPLTRIHEGRCQGQPDNKCPAAKSRPHRYSDLPLSRSRGPPSLSSPTRAMCVSRCGPAANISLSLFLCSRVSAAFVSSTALI